MITVISVWYNESFLAPFFLKHYSFADRIIILLDSATTDNSYDIATKYPNVTVCYFSFPSGMDEKHKVKQINDWYKTVAYGMVINADADEFVFCTKDELESAKWDIARVRLMNVYRHTTDKDLDAALPVREQRRHGEFHWPYRKPIVVRAGMDIQWEVGNHVINVNGKREPYIYHGVEETVPHRQEDFIGAHWVFADPCFAIKRRMERKERKGAKNKKCKQWRIFENINESVLIQQLKDHENDPEVL
jgi:hypothetical protein